MQTASTDTAAASNGGVGFLRPIVKAPPPTRALYSYALERGRAAEHLVCADLILSGYRAFLTEQGLPYDVVIDHKDALLRVQVKSTALPRPIRNRPKSSDSYHFCVRRAGKGGARVISNDEFELLALVALDIRSVAYLPIGPSVLQTIQLRKPGSSKSHGNRRVGNFNEFPIETALAHLNKPQGKFDVRVAA